MSFVAKRQLCEHLSPVQMAALEAQVQSNTVIFPKTLIPGMAMRIDRVQGGYQITYGESTEALRDGDRFGDGPATV